MFKINNIPFPLQGSQEELFNHIAGKSGIPFGGFTYFKILKKSTDARDKGKIHFVYSVGFEVEKKYQQKALKIAEKVEEKLEILHQTHIKASKIPVVVGMGPAGIFATYALCLSGNPPIVLESCRLTTLHGVKTVSLSGFLNVPKSSAIFSALSVYSRSS